MNRLRLLILLVLLAAGCETDPGELSLPADAEKPVAASAAFNPDNTGRVIGHLTWSDRLPEVSNIKFTVPRPDGQGIESHITANPNKPRINPSTRAIGDAVVYLRNIDSAQARPWDLPPVRVSIADGCITVKQGDYLGRNGFVHRGDLVEMVSSEDMFHILRGRGDDFFSLTLPEKNKPVARVMKHEGRIELSSGAGLSWMRADLFVSDHPYFARTEANGQFRLEQIPVGKCELVIWLPSWEDGKPIYEPETAIIARQTYAPARERTYPITIEKGQTTVLSTSLP